MIHCADCRLLAGEDGGEERTVEKFHTECNDVIRREQDSFPLVEGNDEEGMVGRPTIDEQESRARGVHMRNSVCGDLERAGLKRRMCGNRWNSFGHIEG